MDAQPGSKPQDTAHPASYDRSLSDLLKDFTDDLSLLVRQEIDLARVEMTDKARVYAMSSMMMVVAVILALLAVGVLTACIILALNLALPAWAAALIVGGAYLVIAGILGFVGITRLRQAGKPLPEQTMETIKEDVSWAKQQAKSAVT